jgi:hypothetical protein
MGVAESKVYRGLSSPIDSYVGELAELTYEKRCTHTHTHSLSLFLSLYSLSFSLYVSLFGYNVNHNVEQKSK